VQLDPRYTVCGVRYIARGGRRICVLVPVCRLLLCRGSVCVCVCVCVVLICL